jgi:hypothetical protein
MGAMLMMAALITLSGWSRHRRWFVTPSEVMSGDEAAVAEGYNHLDLVLRHHAERIVDAAWRLGRRHRKSRDVRERVAVQQKRR